MTFPLVRPIVTTAIVMAAVCVNSAGAQTERSENAADSAVTRRDSIKIRFTIVHSIGGAESRWVGFLDEVRRDSVVLRLVDGDALAAFARKDLLFLQRWYPSRRPAKGARIGCFVVAPMLLALGLAVPESTAGQIVRGVAIGCGLGALGGAAIGALTHQWWKPFQLPPG